LPNAIKYSTSAQTLALKKGNYWIGTGDVGKGPTSTTDYYNGITPPSGGYTIYLNKASGGPSIYCPANDAALISLTNSIAGASYTTAAQCLTYFATQTDKMVFNIDYPAIVTNGLVLNLDAGFTPSYSTTGTTWYDVSSGGNNGALTNGPTFSSANSGSIVFDGVDDYVSLPNTSLLRPTVFTVISWVNCSVANGNQKTIFSIYAQVSGVAGFGFQHWNGANGNNRIRFFLGNNTFTYGEYTGSINVPINTWNQIGVSYDGTTMIIYVNGTADGSNTYTSGCVYDAVNNLVQVGSVQNSGYFPGNIATTYLYNRALAASEVLQNYNSTKGRFGL